MKKQTPSKSKAKSRTKPPVSDAAARKRERERLKKQRQRATVEGAERNRAQAAAGMARLRRVGREVHIPLVVDQARRDACCNDLAKFRDTYFPHYTYLEPATYHEEIIADFQTALLYGRSQAEAAPRGGAKDTIFLIAVIWAILYGHRHWLVYANASLKFGKKKLENIKFEFEENTLLMEDFPEACVPVRALERSPQRAKLQRIASQDGEAYFSRIVWAQDEIVLPIVEGAVCSGAIISVVGVEGASRGLVRGPLRPDFLCINDGETDEAARSEVQRRTIENTIDQSLSGLAGPGKDIAKFFLCTIVCPGCISEKYTDPSQKPAWNGKRYKMIEQFPEREDLWTKYMELWREGKISGEDPDAREAHAFYVENRETMDAGAVLTWPDRYIRTILADGTQKEISALQHAYNLRVENGETSFWSEYQNEPLPENENSIGLTPRLIASRCGGYAEGIIPANAVRVTRGIDVGARELHSVTKAWMSNGDSYVIDYSRVPVEAPSGDLRDPTGAVRAALEYAVLSALRLAKSEAEDFPFKDTEGNERNVDMTLVDSGFLEKVVYTFCNESGPRYRPVKGYGTLQGQKRYTPPPDKQKNKRPMYKCYASKLPGRQILYHVDADFWKLFAQLRFLQDPETNGACALWGMEPGKHRNYAKHMCAEQYDAGEGKWVKESAHNHFLDATAYADCAGGMVGIRIQALAAQPERDGDRSHPASAPVPVEPKRSGRRVKLPAPLRAKGGARVVRRTPVAW